MRFWLCFGKFRNSWASHSVSVHRTIPITLTRRAARTVTGLTDANRTVNTVQQVLPVTTHTTSPAKRDESASADPAKRGRAFLLTQVADSMTNPQLLRWMFRFFRPVLDLAIIAMFWLTLWVISEILAIRQAGIAVNQSVRCTSMRRSR